MRLTYRRYDKRMLSFMVLAAITFPIPASAQLSTLYNFSTVPLMRYSNDPIGVLVSDSAGNFYGTTSFNGTGGFNCGAFAFCGQVFKLTSNSGGGYTFSPIYSFQGAGDGGHPRAGVLLDPAGSGNLYGTSFDGGVFGTSACSVPVNAGCGTVFTLSSSGTMVWQYQFLGGSDGANPHANLILDPQGNLFGTTSAGGGGSCTSVLPPDPGPGYPLVGGFGYPRRNGCGTVFKLTSTGAGTFQETVLYRFKGGTDGANPYSNLLFDVSGNLYGTTAGGGGTGCGGAGCGTVFMLTPGGTEAVLYIFSGGADGAFPYAGLISDGSGNFYGTTAKGGGTGCGGDGCGTVFKLTPSGGGTFNETILYAFKGSPDGANPYGSLVSDSFGNLYGATRFGGGGNCKGGAGCGTLFQILFFTGQEIVLHAFTGVTEGSNPYAGLYFDGVSAFFGTTQYGGSGSNCSSLEYEPSGCGTVFQLGKLAPTCTDANGVKVPLQTVQYLACPISQLGTSACPVVTGVAGTGPGGKNCLSETCTAQNTWTPHSYCDWRCSDPAHPVGEPQFYFVGETETGVCSGGQVGTTTRTCDAGGIWGPWNSTCQCPQGQLLCFNGVTKSNQCYQMPGITDVNKVFHSWCGNADLQIYCNNSCPAGVTCAPDNDPVNHVTSTDEYCGDGNITKIGGGSDVALVTFLGLIAVWSIAGIWHRKRMASR